jgi:DNA-binding NtrC family response regulator
MQAKLLRVLEEGKIEPIGAAKPISVDVRVIVATHRNLEAMVRDGKFRQDLFHRVYVFPLQLPPLRERREDIPALVEHFAAQVCAQNNWKPVKFTSEALNALQDHLWAGNIRELRNTVERLMLLASDDQVSLEITRSVLSPVGVSGGISAGSGTLSERVEQFEREVILAELKQANFHMTKVAKTLGLERSHLYKKAEQLGIDIRKARREGEEP